MLHDQVGFVPQMESWLIIWQSNIIYLINKLRTGHMMILIDEEKTSDKI